MQQRKQFNTLGSQGRNEPGWAEEGRSGQAIEDLETRKILYGVKFKKATNQKRA